MKPAMHVACAILCCAPIFATPARASVVVSNTRVVYPADAREVTVRLTNQRATPVLVEAWIEPGNAAPDATEPGATVPFAITPPLLRMEPGKGQALRVHRLPSQLPADRETLFWLNVLDLPADPPDAVVANVLKMAVRSRIKLFVRPAGLPGTANRAPERVAWRLVDGVAGASPALRLDNRRRTT
jgi:chaperone protein EcpD